MNIYEFATFIKPNCLINVLLGANALGTSSEIVYTIEEDLFSCRKCMCICILLLLSFQACSVLCPLNHSQSLCRVLRCQDSASLNYDPSKL